MVQFKAARDAWKRMVYDRASEIDDDQQHEWDTLAYGFLLGLGVDHVKAQGWVTMLNDEGLL